VAEIGTNPEDLAAIRAAQDAARAAELAALQERKRAASALDDLQTLIDTTTDADIHLLARTLRLVLVILRRQDGP
jgi:hypothetical protein